MLLDLRGFYFIQALDVCLTSLSLSAKVKQYSDMYGEFYFLDNILKQFQCATTKYSVGKIE